MTSYGFDCENDKGFPFETINGFDYENHQNEGQSNCITI